MHKYIWASKQYLLFPFQASPMFNSLIILNLRIFTHRLDVAVAAYGKKKRISPGVMVKPAHSSNGGRWGIWTPDPLLVRQLRSRCAKRPNVRIFLHNPAAYASKFFLISRLFPLRSGDKLHLIRIKHTKTPVQKPVTNYVHYSCNYCDFEAWGRRMGDGSDAYAAVQSKWSSDLRFQWSMQDRRARDERYHAVLHFASRA